MSDLIAIGGGAASDLWCHILADITGKNVCIPHNREASALGAAIAAAVGAGWYPTFREAANAMSRIDRTIRPNRENRRKYALLYPVYKSIYPNVKETGIEAVLKG